VFSKIFHQRKPSTDHWYNLSIGSSSCHITLSLIKKYGNILTELYIPNDKELFYRLVEHKEEIESSVGFKMEWCELPNRKASRIIVSKAVNFNDKSTWNEQFEWFMDMSLRIRKAFKNYI